MSSRHFFFVALRDSRAVASCIAEAKNTTDELVIREFYRDYTGLEIRKVSGDEMQRLMTADVTASVG